MAWNNLWEFEEGFRGDSDRTATTARFKRLASCFGLVAALLTVKAAASRRTPR
jgi:hypothetical protein